MNGNREHLSVVALSSTRQAVLRRRRATILAALATIMALLVLMAGSASAAPQTAVLAVASSLDEVIDNARNWVMGILAGLATLCLTVAGARYLLGAGDPAETEKAKTAFRAACIGYGLAVLAPVIVAVLKSIVGG
ncbi:pilin [Nocardia sp. FBN12]|uniref:pilin n=1 Tax=Nocardia sp. FBN12 TaxID=3419766 RepID=UPI003CFC2B9B